MIKFLLEHSADINIDLGKHLQLTLFNENAVNFEIIEFLLDRGANQI